MRLRQVVVLVFCGAVLAACSSTTVTSDWNPAVDFGGYRTYAWLEPEGERPGLQLPEHLDIRLRRVVDDVLADQGLQRAPALPLADLLLTYYVGLDRELRVDSYATGWYGPYGYSYWPGWNYGGTRARVYTTGTLVIDMVDRQTKQLVWTGIAESAVHRSNPPSDRIRLLVEKLMAGFPPQ
jgi:hypothetical protein